jgi:hypothetical protein
VGGRIHCCHYADYVKCLASAGSETHRVAARVMDLETSYG